MLYYKTFAQQNLAIPIQYSVTKKTETSTYVCCITRLLSDIRTQANSLLLFCLSYTMKVRISDSVSFVLLQICVSNLIYFNQCL